MRKLCCTVWESIPIHYSEDCIGSVIAQGTTAEVAVKACEDVMKQINIEMI